TATPTRTTRTTRTDPTPTRTKGSALPVGAAAGAVAVAAEVAASRVATTPPTPTSSRPTRAKTRIPPTGPTRIPATRTAPAVTQAIVGGVVGGAVSPAPGTTATAGRPRTIRRTPLCTSGRLGGTRPPTRTEPTARSRASTGRRGWRPSGNAAGTAATPAAAA